MATDDKLLFHLEVLAEENSTLPAAESKVSWEEAVLGFSSRMEGSCPVSAVYTRGGSSSSSSKPASRAPPAPTGAPSWDRLEEMIGHCDGIKDARTGKALSTIPSTSGITHVMSSPIEKAAPDVLLRQFPRIPVLIFTGTNQEAEEDLRGVFLGSVWKGRVA